MVVELRVRLEITPTPALGHGTLDVPREPLPRVIQVLDVVAPQAERGEPPRQLGLLPLLRPVRARDADDLEADDAPGEVPPAVGAADARVDAGGQERVPALAGGRRRRGAGVVRCQGGPGIAVDAPEGDLAAGGLQGGNPVSLGALGGLDLELGPLEEELVSLEVRAVRVSPGPAADIVDIPRVADGENENSGLHVVELFDVARKDVH